MKYLCQELESKFLKIYKAAFCILIGVLLITPLSGCVNKGDTIAKTTGENPEPETIAKTTGENPESETITEEQALEAVKNYCLSSNPDLEGIINEGTYPVYWDISSSDEGEIVVLFRSYTGAQNKYYINRNTGDTYVTEFVPGIMDEEERTNENFNIADY